MPGPVIDPNQNQHELAYGVVYLENENFLPDAHGFAFYHKFADGADPDGRYLPAGCHVNVQEISPPSIHPLPSEWHGIPIDRWVKITGYNSNRGRVVRRIFNLMMRFNTSVFDGVLHPNLPDRRPDTGDHSEPVNIVLTN